MQWHPSSHSDNEHARETTHENNEVEPSTPCFRSQPQTLSRDPTEGYGAYTTDNCPKTPSWDVYDR